MTKRIKLFDIAKGIAILLVVFGHALQGIRDSEGITATSSYSSIYYVCNVIYTFHMPLFFFVSGLFVASWCKRKFSLALKQKVQSLVIPYFIWTLITGIAMQIASEYTNNGLGLKQVFMSWIYPFSEYWFLYVLFFIFLIYYLLFSTMRADKGLILILSFVFYLLEPISPSFWILNNLQEFMIYFVAGSCFSGNILKKYRQMFTLKWSVVSLAVFIGIISTYIFIFIQIKDEFIINTIRIIIAFSGIWTVLSWSNIIERAFDRLSNFLDFNGKSSLAIYVMHLIPLAGSRILVLKVLNFDNLWLVVMTITVVSLLSCYIMYYFISKVGALEKALFGGRTTS